LLIWTAGDYDIKRGEGIPPFVYYSTVSNKGDATLVELELDYRATFFKGPPNRSPVVSTQVVHLNWPALAPNDSFGFYVDNASEFGLVVETTPEVWAKVLGKDRRQKISVVQGNWGTFGLLFDPPRVPPKRIPN
jgi:hypothetical protein